KAESRGAYLEAAMLIGPPPTMFLTAAAPLPYDADEVEVAAKLQGAPIPMRRCRHVDLMVPATTEIVIEGRFIPNERRDEGPVGQVLLAVCGAEPTWARNCTVVDEDVDIYNLDDVMWAVLTRSRPDRDIMIIPETPSFYRDPHKEHWGRMGIDATVPFARR